jgi:hypothetical protein
MWVHKEPTFRRNVSPPSLSCPLTLFLAGVIYSNLKMEATRSSETSIYNKHTRRHILEDSILLDIIIKARGKQLFLFGDEDGLVRATGRSSVG